MGVLHPKTHAKLFHSTREVLYCDQFDKVFTSLSLFIEKHGKTHNERVSCEQCQIVNDRNLVLVRFQFSLAIKDLIRWIQQ